MEVPLIDLQSQYRQIRSELLPALEHILDSCSFILGPAVEAFEQAFAEYCQVKHCVALNSGTSSLHLALRCLNIGPGDEVISVPMTFGATAWAICYVGAKPVFVDIDPIRRTMDPKLLVSAITPQTKAILPVHLYGMPAEIDAVCDIADRHGIPVVEDAAQAHGARYGGRRVGSFGRIGCFSFYPTKNLGAYGEGGALVTHDTALAERARKLRDQGQSVRYYHDEVGYNYRMDALQGAVLGIKLKYLDAWTAARTAHARRYHEVLQGLPIKIPILPPDSESSWHLYVIETDRRDIIRNKLSEAGVRSGLHYPIPLHLQKAFSNLGLKEGAFPRSEALAAQCLSLPMYPELPSEHIAYVCEVLHRALDERPCRYVGSR